MDETGSSLQDYFKVFWRYINNNCFIHSQYLISNLNWYYARALPSVSERLSTLAQFIFSINFIFEREIAISIQINSCRFIHISKMGKKIIYGSSVAQVWNNFHKFSKTGVNQPNIERGGHFSWNDITLNSTFQHCKIDGCHVCPRIFQLVQFSFLVLSILCHFADNMI